MAMDALFMWGAYFRMGAYKRNAVVVIKMGAHIHGYLFCVGAYCPNFTVGISVNSCYPYHTNRLH